MKVYVSHTSKDQAETVKDIPCVVETKHDCKKNIKTK